MNMFFQRIPIIFLYGNLVPSDFYFLFLFCEIGHTAMYTSNIFDDSSLGAQLTVARQKGKQNWVNVNAMKCDTKRIQCYQFVE